jgi:hypothetical protein
LAPTHVSSATSGSSTSNSPSVAVPSGVAANDIVVVFIYAESDTLNISGTPSGFTQAPSSPIRTSNGSPEQTQWVYWKRLTGADSGSYTFTLSGSIYWRAMSVAYRSAVTSGDPWHITNSAARSSASTTTPAVSFTTTIGDTTLVWTGTSWSAGPWTPPSGFTERQDTSTEVTLADSAQAVAGATGSLTGTGPSNWMTAWLGSLLPSGTIISADASFVASATLTVSTPTLVRPASVNLIVDKTLTAAGETFVIHSGAVNLIVNKTLTANGRVTLHQAQVNLSATATFTNTAVRQTHAVSISLSVVTVLEATGIRGRTPILETRYERPAAEHPFRVIVQEILTGEIVDWDLPVSEDFSYTRQLSSPTVMEGEFKPEIISVQDLGLDGFAYWLHVEIDEEIRASAIFLPPRYEGSSLSFSAEGAAAIPHYITWTGTYSAIGVDPFVVVRNIWNHIQSNPRSNFGVVISNNLSGRTLGTPATTEKTTDSTGTVTEREVPAEPYELQWWEAPNCGEEIDSLADQTPFDFKERVVWNADRTDVLHYIDLAYPRMGSPKPDLLFNEENILEIVPLQEPEDIYASEVIVIGSGEGADTIRGYAAENFANRVRKTYVHTDKSITTKARADAVAKSELGIRRGRLFEISEIVVRAKHDNASIGEYDLGDDIWIEVDVPWLNTIYGSWYRIISITHQPSYDHLRIGVSRADSFRYPPTGG